MLVRKISDLTFHQMQTFAWFAQFAHTVVIFPFHSGKTFILNQLVGWNSFRNFTLQNHYNDEKTYISHCGALCLRHGSRRLHQFHCGQRCHRRRVGVIPEAPVIYLRNMSNIILGRAWSPSLHWHHCRSGKFIHWSHLPSAGEGFMPILRKWHNRWKISRIRELKNYYSCKIRLSPPSLLRGICFVSCPLLVGRG